MTHGAAVRFSGPRSVPLRCVFSGVRPSSGAETLQKDTASQMSHPLEGVEVAAAGDGRTPRNSYPTPRRQGVSRTDSSILPIRGGDGSHPCIFLLPTSCGGGAVPTFVLNQPSGPVRPFHRALAFVAAGA